MKLNLELIPRHPGLLAGHDNDIELMVRLSATDFEEQSGTTEPLNLGVVIDRSGSMSGQPLEEANEARAISLIDISIRLLSICHTMLRPTLTFPVKKDECSIGMIERIREGGMTNLHGGWLEGAQQVASHTKLAWSIASFFIRWMCKRRFD